MTLQLTELEAKILERMARSTPAPAAALSGLEVTGRELTGAGSYTYFQSAVPIEIQDGYLAFQDLIVVPGVENGLGAALAVSSGQPEFLEIFTHGTESWDGTSSSFTIT
nr:putative integron gene cassette protein [uncultured bacterium]